MGPSKQAEPLPEQAANQGFTHKEVKKAKDVIVVGCAFLLREIELAAVQRRHFEFSAGTGCGVATLLVETSKVDIEARGAKRSLECTCPLADCPVKAARRVCEDLSRDEHIVQDRAGGPVSKEKMIAVLKDLATLRGAVDVTRITGHSMRVTGAQRLINAGLSLEQVRAFGRWKSVGLALRYLRETAISRQILRNAMARDGRRIAELKGPAAMLRKKWSVLRKRQR